MIYDSQDELSAIMNCGPEGAESFFRGAQRCQNTLFGGQQMVGKFFH